MACRIFTSCSAATARRFYAFDIRWHQTQDLRGVEMIGRRRMLAKALKKAGPALRFSEHMAGADGSRYKSGACKSWLKVKNPAYERRTGA